VQAFADAARRLKVPVDAQPELADTVLRNLADRKTPVALLSSAARTYSERAAARGEWIAHAGSAVAPHVVTTVPEITRMSRGSRSGAGRLRHRQREVAIVALAKSHRAARAVPITGTRIGGFMMLRPMEEEGDEYPVVVTPDPVVTDAMHRLREHARTVRHTILTHSGGCEVLPIHGDFYQANLIYRGETLAAVLDFDECRRDQLFVDLGIAMECLQQHDATAEFVALFRRIYEDVAPLPAKDFAFALVLVAFRQASGALSRSFSAARAAMLDTLERVERLLALAADMLA
jgi:aminoglycoside phosphotransferase (APT) family kinase protein